MSFPNALRVETGRLFRSSAAWLVAGLTLLSPLLGYAGFQPAAAMTRASRLVANPALAGALCGAVLFALLTLWEMDRVHRAEVAVLTDTVVSPAVLNAARQAALLLLGTVTGVLALLLYLPYTAVQMGTVFDLRDTVGCYLILMMMGLWLGSLFAGAFYQATRRVDVSFVLIAACALLSMSQYWHQDFLLRWINPIIPVLSDDFSNRQPLWMALYNRAFWLLVLGGLWALSSLCTRRYGKGLFRSFAWNARRAYVPALAILLIICGVTAYAGQPFVNHAPLDVYADAAAAERSEDVTLLSTHVDARPNLTWGTQHGTATYHMRNTGSESVRQLVSINCGYTVKSLAVNGQPTAFEDLHDDIVRAKHVAFLLPPGDDIEVIMEYGGYPQLWSLARAIMGGDEIERRYIYLTGPAFAPAMEAEPGRNNRITADIALPSYMSALVNGGEAERVAENEDSTAQWRLTANSPHIYLYAADYVRQDVSTEEMSVDFFYSRKHEAVMERVNIHQTLGDVLQYCAQNVGPLHFAENSRLKLVQITAFMFGGYASNGMSVMGETSFAEEGLNDPLKGASGNEVMAHEIIHQWWGLGRMFTEWSPDVDIEWSSEGFTVYTTYRLMKELYGDAYAKKYYVDVWREQVDALQRDFYHRHSEYLDRLPEQYAAMIRSANETTRRYCEMPLKILKAAELVGGEERMDGIMADLFTTQELEMPPYLSYQDFLNACGLTKEALNLD